MCLDESGQLHKGVGELMTEKATQLNAENKGFAREKVDLLETHDLQKSPMQRRDSENTPPAHAASHHTHVLTASVPMSTWPHLET